MSSGPPPRPPCPHCGHEATGGRFCPECGRPLSSSPGAGADADADATTVRDAVRDDTAERPRVEDPPTEVPETSPWGEGRGSQVPPAARWPLYADQAAGPPRERPDRDDVRDAVPPVVPMTEVATDGGRRHGPLPWLLGAVLVLVLAGAGAVLLLGGLGGGDDPDAASSSARDDSTTSPTPSASPSVTPTPTPSARPSSPPPLQPVDVSRQASVVASRTAPPSTDVGGDPVTYQAANMLDDDPSTAWRVGGDGRGVELTVTLARPTVVTRLGLVNGYAKSEPGYDGYAANRRVTSVDWVLDDGTVVPQSLGETTSVQTVDVPEVETRVVTLRVRGTTPPGPQDGRDYTAVSEVRVVGDPR